MRGPAADEVTPRPRPAGAGRYRLVRAQPRSSFLEISTDDQIKSTSPAQPSPAQPTPSSDVMAADAGHVRHVAHTASGGTRGQVRLI